MNEILLISLYFLNSVQILVLYILLNEEKYIKVSCLCEFRFATINEQI